MQNVYLISFAIIACVLCAGCINPIENGRERGVQSASIWQALEEPIIQRYDISGTNLSAHGRQNQASGLHQNPNQSMIENAFECSEEQASTVTDEIPLLDVSFIEADILDAILELSLLTGITIITDDNIEGIVSVNFVGKSLDEVLAAIITPGNYGYKKYASFIYVGSQNPLSDSLHLLSTTCLYKPVFLQPKEIVELLTLNYQQYVNFYEGHDHISIVAPNSIQRRIQHDIRLIDKMPDQILLEMSIIEVSSKALDILGVKWKTNLAGNKQMSKQNHENIYSFYDQRNISISLASSLIDSFGALNSDDKFQIRAMPSIVTLNGKEANFSSTETVWLPVFGGSSQQPLSITYGINLKIIPFVSHRDHIRLEILQASVSDLTENQARQPVLINHAISTSVLMRDGETLVLGGLLQKKRRNRENKVPGASKLPVFGRFFSHTHNTLEHTEVLIVIRPKILDI